jgi:hypothetical protein
MELLERITDRKTICIKGTQFKVLGKAFYTTQNDTESRYAKILLDNHYVLVISPADEIYYFGKNEGQISAFDSQKISVEYQDKTFKQVNHDYQIVLALEFGSPLEVEGEVEFWDYEADNTIISVAKVSRNNSRADVVAEYISFEDIIINK